MKFNSEFKGLKLLKILGTGF